MEIRHLQTFITIIDMGGFTKAAEHLGYAQSTITSHIQLLENEISTPLFNRLGKKMAVTDTGRELIPYAREMLSLYRDIKNIGGNNEIAGQLNIGAGESLSIYRLGSILKEYKDKYPKVNIILKNSICSDLRRRLKTGELDVVFTIEPEIKDEDLSIKILKDDKMMFISPPGSKLDLFSSNIIFSEKGCSLRIVFESYLKLEKAKYNNPLELTSIEAIKKCVMSGLGISVLPLYTIMEELNQGSITAMEAGEEFKKFKTQLVCHKDLIKSPALEAFIEIALKHSAKWK